MQSFTETRELAIHHCRKEGLTSMRSANRIVYWKVVRVLLPLESLGLGVFAGCLLGFI